MLKCQHTHICIQIFKLLYKYIYIQIYVHIYNQQTEMDVWKQFPIRISAKNKTNSKLGAKK